VEQGQNEQYIPALGSGWPLSEISYKTEGGLLLAHTPHQVSVLTIIIYS